MRMCQFIALFFVIAAPVCAQGMRTSVRDDGGPITGTGSYTVETTTFYFYYENTDEWPITHKNELSVNLYKRTQVSAFKTKEVIAFFNFEADPVTSPTQAFQTWTIYRSINGAVLYVELTGPGGSTLWMNGDTPEPVFTPYLNRLRDLYGPAYLLDIYNALDNTLLPPAHQDIAKNAVAAMAQLPLCDSSNFETTLNKIFTYLNLYQQNIN